MQISTVLFLLINGLALDVFAECKSGLLSGDVTIEGDETNCTITCDNVTVVSSIPKDDTCRFKFDSKVSFLEDIANLTFKGYNAFSFVSTNDDIVIRYPINVGGNALTVAKEYEYPRVLGGFHSSVKNGSKNPGNNIIRIDVRLEVEVPATKICNIFRTQFPRSSLYQSN